MVSLINSISKGFIYGCAAFVVLMAPATAQPQVELKATASAVESFFGTADVKLVVSVDNYLYLVDYSQSTPAFVQLQNTEGAILPHISNDGKYVVFAKGPSGDLVNDEAATSSTYVMELKADAVPVLVAENKGFEPRFVRGTEAYEIVYSSKGKWGAWDGVGETYKRAMSATGELQAEGVLTSTGSFYGGANQSYIASGGNRGVMMPLEGTSADTVFSPVLFTSAGDENTDERQVCNPSISPGGSPEIEGVMLGLDFGSAYMTNPEINGNKPWSSHQVLFMIHNSGNLMRDYKVPGKADVDGLVTADDSYTSHIWDDTEWSNHASFASGNIEVNRSWQVNGNWESGNGPWFERVFAINLKDSAYLQLASSTDLTITSTTNLKWPVLHIGGTQSSDLDWLGVEPNEPQIMHSSEVVQRTYFTLSGQALQSGEALPAVYIVREEFSNGAVRLQKQTNLK